MSKQAPRYIGGCVISMFVKKKLKCSRISRISCGSSSNSSERQREIKGQRERKKREKHILLEV